jgi:hypothetical protein
MPKTSADEEWEKYNLSGKLACEHCNYKKAEQMWEKALAIAEKFDKRDIRLHLSLSSLAVLYNMQHRHNESTALFNRSQEIWSAEDKL